MRWFKRIAAGAFLGLSVLVAASVAAHAQAQQGGAVPASSSTLPVILWTLTVAVLAMLALSLGYLYRHIQGQPDEVISKDVPAFGEGESHGDPEHTYGETHPEDEVHGDTGAEQPEHSDAIIAVGEGGARGAGQPH